MNREQIIQMAQQAGFVDYELDDGTDEAFDIRYVRFAILVANAENEACAKVAKTISDKYGWGHYGNEVDTADEIAATIRARAQT